MKIRSKIDNLVKSINGYYLVTLQVPKIAVNDLFKLKDDDLDVEIKKHREKRSLTANSYLWVLCRDLAQELSKESPTTAFDVYRLMLRRYSTWWDIIYVSENMFNLLKSQEEEKNATYRIVDDLDRKDGQVKAKVWVGSSTFNTEQMSRVIDGIVSECKERGIDTMPPDELERLVSEWN